MEHTHLVKGLDYALLTKVKSEHEQKEKDVKEKAIKEEDEQPTIVVQKCVPNSMQ